MKKYAALISLVIILMSSINAGSASPSGIVTQNDFTLIWLQNDNYTSFILNVTNLNNTARKNWVAFGFGINNYTMGNNDIILCNAYDTDYEPKQFYAASAARPQLLDQKDPHVGVGNWGILTLTGYVLCNVDRLKKKNGVQNYFDLSGNQEYYILFASGPVDGNGKQNVLLNIFFFYLPIVHVSFIEQLTCNFNCFLHRSRNIPSA